jgi:hypothetical protein
MDFLKSCLLAARCGFAVLVGTKIILVEAMP